ncbi:hypothetical protein N7478_006423 [Penicillium angulare]|uniref:uncharacterized protein n=1 Tax=Penicillium angulare TaxID=116970 RepID=UPI0025418F14|nr:uncharacterized protein N7478_006423 [Penicillium angulare]KAJ5281051.1 hypothetical protein N7478_006423 [Penicillium angulare]
MRTKPFNIKRKGPRNGTICFNPNKLVTSVNRPRSGGNDAQNRDDSSCEEDVDIDSDDWDFKYQLGHNKDRHRSRLLETTSLAGGWIVYLSREK